MPMPVPRDAGVAEPLVEAPPAIDLTARPPCVEVKELRDVEHASWGPILRDLARHIEHDGPWLADELSTAAHESTHLMNTQINRAHNQRWGQANAFYALNDCGILMPEPKVRKSDAAAYLPDSMRGLRFAQYITGQESWDDVPTYIFDEWIAYTHGSAAALELRDNGNWGDKRSDALAGQVEFTAYGLALGMAVRDLDPTYFAAETAFVQFVAWNARRSLDQYRAGRDDDRWPSEESHAIYAAMRDSADGAAMRAFVTEVYGADFAATLFDL